jgi:translation elongation factor EF-4
MVVRRALVSLPSTTQTMHRTPSLSLTDTTGKAVFSKFVRTAMQAVDQASVVVVASVAVEASAEDMVAATEGAADLVAATEVVAEVMEVAMAEGVEATAGAVDTEVAMEVVEAVEAVAMAPHQPQQPLLLLRIPSPTTRPLAPSQVRSSTCAT